MEAAVLCVQVPSALGRDARSVVRSHRHLDIGFGLPLLASCLSSKVPIGNDWVLPRAPSRLGGTASWGSYCGQTFWMRRVRQSQPATVALYCNAGAALQRVCCSSEIRVAPFGTRRSVQDLHPNRRQILVLKRKKDQSWPAGVSEVLELGGNSRTLRSSCWSLTCQRQYAQNHSAAALSKLGLF